MTTHCSAFVPSPGRGEAAEICSFAQKAGEAAIQHDSYKEQRDYQTKASSVQAQGQTLFQSCKLPSMKAKVLQSPSLFSSPSILSHSKTLKAQSDNFLQ